MQTTRNRLLVTLVLMTVAVAVACPAHVSARPSTPVARSSSDTYGTSPRNSTVVLNGEPETPGNTAPTPTVGPITVVVQPGGGSGQHATLVPVSSYMGSMFMWAGRIWAAQFGVAF